jgi:hypothetical protein
MICALLIGLLQLCRGPSAIRKSAKLSNPLNRYKDPHLRITNQNLSDIKELHTIASGLWQCWKLRQWQTYRSRRKESPFAYDTCSKSHIECVTAQAELIHCGDGIVVDCCVAQRV